MTLLSRSGAKSLLVDDQLAQQDLALLAVLDFLCECGAAHPIRNLLFKPQEVRRRLLLLLKQKDFGKPLHLRIVSSFQVMFIHTSTFELFSRPGGAPADACLFVSACPAVPAAAAEASGRGLAASGGF